MRVLLGLYPLTVHNKDCAQSPQKRNGAVHLVMDGWTSPILACYLGIVAIWFSAGKVHRCILEFARYETPSS